MARPFLSWVGGKEKLAPFIRQVLPADFTQYVEPFGGSGAILLGLTPSPARLFIYNDYDDDLVNLFLCVRDRTVALLRELDFLPLRSRAEFMLLKQLLRRQIPEDLWLEEEKAVVRECFEPADAEILLEILDGRAQLGDVRRAAAFYKVNRYSFSGTNHAFGVKSGSLRPFFRLICEAAVRLTDVVIENKDAVALIRERDRPTGVLYCDPPYFRAERHYRPLFTRRAHVRLYHALRACEGYVLVSYNDCPYIRNLYKDFFILAFTRSNPLAQRAGEVYRELLITNYDPRVFMRQCSLFDEQRELGGMRLVRIPRDPIKII